MATDIAQQQIHVKVSYDPSIVLKLDLESCLSALLNVRDNFINTIKQRMTILHFKSVLRWAGCKIRDIGYSTELCKLRCLAVITLQTQARNAKSNSSIGSAISSRIALH